MRRRHLPLDTWDDALERTVQRAAALVDGRAAIVSVVVDDLELFVAHIGLTPELEVSRAVARASGLTQLVCGAGSEGVVVIEDTAGDPAMRPEIVEAFGVRAFVGAPVRLDGEVIGCLACIDNRSRSFAPAAVAAFGGVADEVSAHLASQLGEVGESVAVLRRRPYLRLLQAVQVGALPADALSRALRALPPVPHA